MPWLVALLATLGAWTAADAAPPAQAATDPTRLNLSPATRDLGGWAVVRTGPGTRAGFVRSGGGGAGPLQLSDPRGDGVAAITAPFAARSAVTIRGLVNIYAMRLAGGATRPLAWVTGGNGERQEAGVINIGGRLRWATWLTTAAGRRRSVSVGRTGVVLRHWHTMALRTRWASRRARTTLSVDGRVVVLSRPRDVSGRRANAASLGLGRASKARQAGLVLLRSAAIRFGLHPDPSPAPAPGRALPPLSPEVRPYSSAFAFNELIPATAATDARSDAVVARLAENTRTTKVALNAQGEVPPVYVASPSDPLLSVTVGGIKTRFRVPAAARAGSGSDHPLVILDPNSPVYGRHTELRLWRASVASVSLSAAGAGLFHYNSDNSVLNPDGSQSLGVPFAGSGTGSGLSILAGLIRGDEVRAGEINHALRFAYSTSDFSNRFRVPAVKSDQPQGTTTRDPASAMDMGMRLQLDRSVDCGTRTVPGASATGPETRFLRMVCRALQDYGMIAVDGTTGGVLFMAEDSATADWGSLIGAQVNSGYGYIVRDARTPGDGLSRDATSGIPWDKLRVLARSDF